MSDDQSPNYLRFEIPGWGTDSHGVPMTSYLRLGAVGLHEGQLPDLRLDPGEDLALRVRGFADDDRHRADPPSLDAAVESGAESADAEGPTEAELATLKAELDAATKLSNDLDDMLDAILPDPEEWLDGMLVQRLELVAAVEDQTAKYADALAKLTGGDDVERIPPHYSAPGADLEATKVPPTPPSDLVAQTRGQVDTPPSSSDGGAAEPQYTPYVFKVDRRKTTAGLHTLGGVRDHTDGNRISTTRGDKVEVVGGHYRFVVLGRTDDPTDGDGNAVLPGFDISGGQMVTRDATRVVPETSIGWTQRWNGTWHFEENSLKGDTHFVTLGDHDDENHGHVLVSTVGSEDPDAWHEPEDCPGGACRCNPKIVDRTWAESIETRTGSAKLPLPKMSDGTWVETMRSLTKVDSHSDERIGGTFTTLTEAITHTTETRAGSMSTRTVAGTIHERTNVGTKTATMVAGLSANANLGRVSNTLLGLSVDAFLGARTNLSLAGAVHLTAAAQLSAFVGVQADVTLGAVVNVQVQGNKQITLGPADHICTGASTELSLVFAMMGAHIEVG